MNLNEYQKQAYKYAKYPESVKGVYNALQIANELGEVAGKFIKSLRDGMSDKLKNDIADEIGDVIWHMAGLCSDLDLEFKIPITTKGIIRGYDTDVIIHVDDIPEMAEVLFKKSEKIARMVNVIINHYEINNIEVDLELMYKSITYSDYYFINSILTQIINQLGFNLDDILQNNLDKLESRFQRGVISGSGDKR